MPTEPIARSAQCSRYERRREFAVAIVTADVHLCSVTSRRVRPSLYTQESQSHAAPLPNYGKLGKQVCRLWFTSPRSEPGAWRTERCKGIRSSSVLCNLRHDLSSNNSHLGGSRPEKIVLGVTPVA